MDFVAHKISDEETEITEEADQQNEPDLPPEYCHYRDEGCEFLDSCLN